MDSIRGLHFIPSINGLVSASEDCTLKVWDVSKFSSLKEIEGVINFEPYLTLRGHLEPILSLSGRTNNSLLD
jgi:WD40 repeat protein